MQPSPHEAEPVGGEGVDDDVVEKVGAGGGQGRAQKLQPVPCRRIAPQGRGSDVMGQWADVWFCCGGMWPGP